ncbi:putative Bile acid 7-alpha [Seiridium unicorne]|uniref:Bile acid 7-alpha n=1 Tax=Seiridium unicorne TaxID=138068 RepID=A0ABR2V3S0_9PEZI
MPEVSPEVAAVITRKKLWYCRYADTRQWHLFDKVALPECTFEYQSNGEILVNAGFTYAWSSTEQFTSFFSKAFENLQTLHTVGPGEFEQVSEDQVKAVFTVVYYSALKKGAESSHGVQGTGGGHYFETYRRKGDDWFLETLTMNRIYEKDG